jgi:hypothetical protein
MRQSAAAALLLDRPERQCPEGAAVLPFCLAVEELAGDEHPHGLAAGVALPGAIRPIRRFCERRS